MDGKLIITAAATNKVLDLSEEDEDLLVAIILNLLKDEMILSASVVYEDILDAEDIEF